MDFYRISEVTSKQKGTEVIPSFIVCRSKDLMVQGKQFYAIWDEKKGLWSTDEYDVQRLIDEELREYMKNRKSSEEEVVSVKWTGNFSTGVWRNFRNYMANISDNAQELDSNLTFSNTEVTRSDYVTKRLPYPLAEGEHTAYDELIDTLYSPEDRAKIEWAFGAILSGEAKYIQKFLVFYGSGGTGKSTMMNIAMKLFKGYYTTFDAKALTSNNNAFATEAFKGNPLVAIQHDGDLSRIEDNTKLNSIVSHEEMQMNEKFKPTYQARVNAFLLMGTNKPVKITDAKSGIIRRLIDVRPTGNLLSPQRYQAIYSQIDFELGAIAHHCLTTYRAMGRDYYSEYMPTDMMLQTDVFFNYVEAHYDVFSRQDGVSLKQAYELYKTFCDETNVDYKMAQFKFREELKNYFNKYEDHIMKDGIRISSYFSEFEKKHFSTQVTPDAPEKMTPLIMDQTVSYFDKMMGEQVAQYAKGDGTPERFWDDSERIIGGVLRSPDPGQIVETTLKDLDTSKLHFVKIPQNHIVIDFDMTNDEGVKDPVLNLEEASKWPLTYAEFSKSGGGIHLHYIWDGDVTELATEYKPGIEVKVYSGNSSLRRKLSTCNNLPFTTINSGIPLKEKKMISDAIIKSEKGLRDLIERNLRKEIHPGTKPSIDFIHKILDEHYDSDLSWDLTDMRTRILTFATQSTNQALAAIKKVQDMKFMSKDRETNVVDPEFDAAVNTEDFDLSKIVYYDVEVFPNLFIVNWKRHGTGEVVRMINPEPHEIQELTKELLVGFNCRRYDNHILYGRIMGYTNEQLYRLSQNIISNKPNAGFGAAYNLSFADIYDFSSKKQSLKKFQVDLGIHHKELGLPWDEPVPESQWEEVAEYCDNDVISTEATFMDRYQDFVARQILAELSGLPINDTTQKHTAQIIFEGDKRPQDKFEYTHLSEYFEGYKYEFGKSTYRGEEVGEGGYVYAEPGYHENVVELDVQSMHPTSIEELNLFGIYTKNFSALKKARVAIKHGDYESAGKMLNGALKPYLKSKEDAEALSYALKIVINIVYGLTSAKFPNPFKDNRNIDNIVAKRGALFMIDLKNAVQAKGYQVVHIKTDSIKIANADEDIIEFVMEYGNDWGYIFEHDGTYEKMCLVNNAVFIARVAPGRKPGYWKAVGAQFQHPYVYKTLFSKEEITFDDLTETKSVTSALYIDFGQGDGGDVDDTPMALEEGVEIKPPQFVGKVGSFSPIKPGCGGGILLREKDGKFYAATGSKGYYWMESEMVKGLQKENDVDISFFEKLATQAKKEINKHVNYDEFVKEYI